MANFEILVPFIIKWETGTTRKAGESNAELFERARKRGYACDKDDRGGATQTGLTIGAYTSFCSRHKISQPTIDNLKNIPYKTWLRIVKEDYWDRWKADEIASQKLANILVDWVWASGVCGITYPQKMLGVVVDGRVGIKTLTALNGKNPDMFYHDIEKARIKFIGDIVKVRPSQAKFYKGWKNRILDIQHI